jgi:hypothetical protein
MECGRLAVANRVEHCWMLRVVGYSAYETHAGGTGRRFLVTDCGCNLARTATRRSAMTVHAGVGPAGPGCMASDLLLILVVFTVNLYRSVYR